MYMLQFGIQHMHNSSTWTTVTLPLPPEAFATDTQFRWSGPENCQNCEFAIDFGMTPIV